MVAFLRRCHSPIRRPVQTTPCTAPCPRGLPSVHSRGPQRKTAAQGLPSLHSWVIVITQIRFLGRAIRSLLSAGPNPQLPVCVYYSRASHDRKTAGKRPTVEPVQLVRRVRNGQKVSVCFVRDVNLSSHTYLDCQVDYRAEIPDGVMTEIVRVGPPARHIQRRRIRLLPGRTSTLGSSTKRGHL